MDGGCAGNVGTDKDVIKRNTDCSIIDEEIILVATVAECDESGMSEELLDPGACEPNETIGDSGDIEVKGDVVAGSNIGDECGEHGLAWEANLNDGVKTTGTVT